LVRPFQSAFVEGRNISDNIILYKRNHVNDPLEVPIEPITRVRATKLKEAVNGLVQNVLYI
jgi:hypothetical protein